MKKLTPVIVVEEIESALPFWTGLGFTLDTSVPEGDRLGFAILSHGTVEVMYQSMESVRKDIPALASLSRTNLFIEVEKLEQLIHGLKGYEVTVPLRDTFYGSKEYGVRAPCGTCVTFAEFPPSEA
ncbi:MAG: VOC family protein [Gemmatimonadota bacterium]